jgi:hypothetical protein
MALSLVSIDNPERWHRFAELDPELMQVSAIAISMSQRLES